MATHIKGVNTLKFLKNIDHETESPGLSSMCVKEY